MPAPGGRVLLRCYAELNDYLPRSDRQRDLILPVAGRITVGEALERFGIPLAAVEIAMVNGVSSGLDRVLRDGDRVSLYPVFESFDVTALLRLREQPLRQVRFVADAHLGRLARYLRLLGFDTLFENDLGDAELARISTQQRRILLSRDRCLLGRRSLTHGLWIQSVRPREQIRQVVDRLDLYQLFRPFTRCTLCNGALRKITTDPRDLPLPARVKALQQAFWRCDGCGRIYWQGSHYERLLAFVERLAAEKTGSTEGDKKKKRRYTPEI